MKYRFAITFHGLADFKRTKARFADAISKALGDAIAFWHHQYRAKHFRLGADRQYDYRARKPRIYPNGVRVEADEMKRRRSGHANPLMQKGWLRYDTARRIEIKTGKRRPVASGRMRGPEYLRPAGRPARTATGGLQPDMGAELTTILPSERKRILERVRKSLLARLGDLRNRRTVRIG